MKKLIFVFAIAGFIAACNNAGEGTENKKDSLDSVANVKKDVVDSVAEQKKDVIDSATQQKKEALDKADSAKKKDTSRRH